MDQPVGETGDPTERPARSRLMLLLGLALLARLIVAAVSIGSNDAILFHTFAVEIRKFGVIETYQLDGLFNHPPLVALWARAALLFADRLPQPFGEVHAFCFIFKLPIIAADVLGAWLIWKIWRRKLGSKAAGAIAAAAAWSLCGIAISAYHCNTDPLYAALCLAAVYLMEERESYFLGGLTLAAAINVKIVPVLLIPGLLLSCRSPDQARKFFLGLAIGAAPFLPVLAKAAPSFAHNALAYNSSVNNWGVTVLLVLRQLFQGNFGATSVAVDRYHDVGRYVLFALIGGWAVLARVRNLWTRYEIAVVSLSLFLIFTPGFGIQYLAMVGLLLFACHPRIATLYAVSAGAFAAALYLTALHRGEFPFLSNLERYHVAEAFLGVIPWAVLVCFVAATLRRAVNRSTERSLTGQPMAGSYTSARAA